MEQGNDGLALDATRVQAPPGSEARAQRSRTVAVIAFGIFCTTFAQTAVIGALPIRYLLTQHFHYHAKDLAGFFFWATFPWYLKVVFGLCSDAFPLMGTRRRNYLLLSGFSSLALWTAIGAASQSIALVMAAIVGLNVAMVIGSTVSGGLIVEQGQAMGATGRLSSLRLVLMNGAGLIGVPLGGWLNHAIGFRGTAIVAAASCLPLVIATAAWLREKERAERNMAVWSEAWDALKQLGRARLLWITAGLWALVKIAPGFGSVLFVIQSDTFKLNSAYLANLSLPGALTGLITAALYFRLCRNVSIRTMLIIGITGAALFTVPYLIWAGTHAPPTWEAMTLEAFGGIFGTLAALPLFDMAARTTPLAAASLGYALLMSVNNIVQQLADVIGSQLHDTFHWGFGPLVWLNAGTTALVLVVIPFLPRGLMESHDS